MQSYMTFWRSRVSNWGYGKPELWETFISHPILYARLAALDLLIDDLADASRAEVDGFLRLANRFNPQNPHITVANDQFIRHLNLQLDEIDREIEDWSREFSRRNYAFQYSRYNY